MKLKMLSAHAARLQEYIGCRGRAYQPLNDNLAGKDCHGKHLVYAAKHCNYDYSHAWVMLTRLQWLVPTGKGCASTCYSAKAHAGARSFCRRVSYQRDITVKTQG